MGLGSHNPFHPQNWSELIRQFVGNPEDEYRSETPTGVDIFGRRPHKAVIIFVAEAAESLPLWTPESVSAEVSVALEGWDGTQCRWPDPKV